MKTTTTVQLLGALALLTAGCMADEGGSSGRAGSLDACPDDIREGDRCDFDREIACSIGMRDVACRCARSDDGAGRIVCGPLPPDPGGGGLCTDHVRSGDVCDPTIDTECHHACDPSVVCRCLPSPDMTDPAADRRPCTHAWVCGAPPPPVDPRECTDEHVRACEVGMGAMVVECTRGGRICRCGGTADGTLGLVCEEPPPPPPGVRECTDELIRACLDGMHDPSSTDLILCYRGSSACRCVVTADGRAEVLCEEPPPPGDTCTDDVLRRCAAGEMVRCTRPDGIVCYCDPSSTTGLRCEGPPPPPPGGDTCTDALLARCHAGEAVMCTRADGVSCHCDPRSTMGFICTDSTDPRM